MGTTSTKGNQGAPVAPPPPGSPSSAVPPPPGSPFSAIPPPPGSPSNVSNHKTWKPVEITKFEFNFDTEPANVDGNLQWDKAIGCSKAPDGSAGVLFVQLAEGAVVVKGSNSLASEVFATSVARSLGIPGPRMRVVAMRSEEGKVLKAMIQKLDQFLVYMVDMRYVVIMEYLVGYTLKSIDSTIFAQFTGVKENKVTILRQIGALAALDALLNNSDRVPLIAQNPGNPGNLMFNKTNGHVISLDNSIVSLKGNALVGYVERVASILQPICANPSQQSGACSRIADVIKQYTAMTIGDAGMINIQEGIAQCVVECIRLDMASLMKTKQTLSRIDENVVGLELISEEFLEVMLLVFRHVQSSQDPLDYSAIQAEAKSNIAKRALQSDVHRRRSSAAKPAVATIAAAAARDGTGGRVATSVVEMKTVTTPDSISEAKHEEEDDSDSEGTESETEDQKETRTAQEMVSVNQQIGRTVDPITYEECLAIKGYGDAILITRALLSPDAKISEDSSRPNSPKDLKTQGKILLEISRALVMVETQTKLQRSPTAMQTALSDVTQQLRVFLAQASAAGSGSVQLAAFLIGRKFLALLTVLQQHSTQKGASALFGMVQKAMAEMEFSYVHLRLACDGKALDSSSVELMQSASALLQRSLLDFLNAAQDASSYRSRSALRVECQSLFLMGREASDLLTSLSPLLLSKGHYNQLTLALDKLAVALPVALQTVQNVFSGLRPSKRASLARLTSAINGLNLATGTVRNCLDCAEAETQTQNSSSRQTLAAVLKNGSLTDVCAQSEALARSVRR